MSKVHEIADAMEDFLDKGLDAGKSDDELCEKMIDDARRRFPDATDEEIIAACITAGYRTAGPHQLPDFEKMIAEQVRPAIEDADRTEGISKVLDLLDLAAKPATDMPQG